ncbi:sulfite exporter TauE/SafE family protein [bacterium]|nr:sulfite exporter TauE/SafE family protein [bacterium]
MKKGFFVILAFLTLLFASTGHAYEIGGDDENPFSVYFDESPEPMTQGASTTFKFLFQIPPEYYLYADKLTVELDPPGGISLGTLVKPLAEVKMDPYLEKEVEIYHNELSLDLPVSISAQIAPGTYALSGVIKLQGCSTELCYRPMTYPITINLTVNGTQVTPPTTSDSFFAKTKKLLQSSQFSDVAGLGFLWSIFVAFLGGLLTDLTPCVWPMIPVTLVVIGLHKDKSIFHNLFYVSVMVAGMAFMYSILGLIVAALGKSFGFLFQNVYFLTFIILFLVVMALSLFDLFHFHIPQFLHNFLAKISTAGVGGIFFTGMTLGFMATPCVGPIVGPLLVYVAKTQNILEGFVLMFAYAMGMGTIFVVIGTFYGSFTGRLKSGAWMTVVKKILGVLLLVVAAYYAFSLYQPTRSHQHSNQTFVYSLGDGLDRAQKENKPVLIDFFATWCLPCMELDKTVFENEIIDQELKDAWVPIKIDCSQSTPACEEAIKRYNIIGWPTVVFLDRNQQEVSEERLVGKVIKPTEMTTILNRVKGKK